MRKKFKLDQLFKLEKDFQKYVMDYIKRLQSIGFMIHGTVIPGNGMAKRGVSDVLLCVDGKFVAMELKNGDTSYSATPSQLAYIRSIENAGGKGGVYNTFEEVYNDLSRILDRELPLTFE